MLFWSVVVVVMVEMLVVVIVVGESGGRDVIVVATFPIDCTAFESVKKYFIHCWKTIGTQWNTQGI
jgi:hypothetical protein